MNPFTRNMTRYEVASSSIPVTFFATFVLLSIVFLSVISASGQVTDEFPVPPSFAIEGIPTIRNADVEHLFRVQLHGRQPSLRTDRPRWRGTQCVLHETHGDLRGKKDIPRQGDKRRDQTLRAS